MNTKSLALLAGALTLLATGCTAKLSGKADVKSKEHGDFSIKPDQCASGEHQDFFGVDLREGDDRKIVRIIKDPDTGYSVKINIPDSDKAITVNKSVCKTFKVSVKKQNSEINNISNVKGKAKIKCKVEGITVKANVKFENCH
jgi:hypothetical protein